MNITAYLLVVLYIRLVRQLLRTKETMPREENLLAGAQIGLIVLMGLSFLLDKPYEAYLNPFWQVGLLVCLYVCYRAREQRLARMLMLAIAPYSLYILVDDGLKLMTGNLAGTREALDLIDSLTFTWLIGFTFYTIRQRKAMEKEQAERERERAANETRRAELEQLVTERTAEITRQKEALEATLQELQLVQNQLIQQEKLASLGELTAGIAHEIQNPLNFVNNFAEVSTELIDELQQELGKGTGRDAELEAELVNDLAQNLQKIHHHGGRASSIVKGMLQHSRTSTGQREPVDLNALADEYLKLAYHGLRAKDKTFNARFDISADPAVGLVELVPQDIGRVLLNLYNNAFYATRKRASGQEPAYQPSVTVRTERRAGEVCIWVTDNGQGIPEALQEKIFVPFFTTKPTGEGTGLGLSLAYDIVTKGHGGQISVSSREGEGTQFTIRLPVTSSLPVPS